MEATEARARRAREKYDADEYGSNSGPPSLDGEKAPKRFAGGNLSLPETVKMWPTATALDATNTANATANRTEGSQHHDGTTLVGAVKMWQTPRATSPADCPSERASSSPALETQVSEAWNTPRSRDHKDGGKDCLTTDASLWTTPQASEPDSLPRPSRTKTGRTTEYLGRQAVSLYSLPDQPTSTPGEPSLPSGRTSRPRLNPAFVNFLQGLPENWLSLDPIGSEFLEIWSFRFRRQLRLLCYGIDW